MTVGVATTVVVPEGVPSSSTKEGAVNAEDSWRKWSCVPRGLRESIVGEVLISARVDKVLGEWGGVGGR